MSKIHYFQRYSSLENTVTNNTLQLFARIYEYSATAASSLLSDITGEPIEIGIEVQQQKAGINSVPDGAILQRSFKILLESKVEAGFDIQQLMKHAQTFERESQKLLLLLTKQPLKKSDLENAKQQIGQVSQEIVFKNVTYEDICNSLKGRFKEHESTMAALVEDYIEYCNDTGLFDQSKFLMRIVPCGESIEINKKHGLYFQPSDRGYTRHAFVGIYSKKKVQLVLEVQAVFDIQLQADGTLLKTLVEGEATDRFDKRLAEIIGDAKTVCGYDVRTGHRFFCGEPFETEYEKESHGGIFGARLVDLREIIGSFIDARDVANRLRSVKWQ